MLRFTVLHPELRRVKTRRESHALHFAALAALFAVDLLKHLLHLFILRKKSVDIFNGLSAAVCYPLFA